MEQRWVAQLASFNFEVKYRTGRENTNADVLSRLPTAYLSPEQPTTSTADGIMSAAVEHDGSPPDQSNNWVIEQQAVPNIQTAKRYVVQGSCPRGPEQGTLTVGAARLLKQYKRLCVREGVLCRRFIDPNTHEQMYQIVCPGPKRQEVWRQHHEAGAHAGRTLTTLRRRFFWVDMESEVRGFKTGCVVCSLQKDRKKPRAPLNPVIVTYLL